MYGMKMNGKSTLSTINKLSVNVKRNLNKIYCESSCKLNVFYSKICQNRKYVETFQFT